MEHFEFNNFDYSNWKKPEHIIAQDRIVKTELYQKGYSVKKNFLDENEVSSLLKQFNDLHCIEAPTGGFFVSIYSKNLEYRKTIHDYLFKKLDSKFSEIFSDYKYTCLNFAAKYQGDNGELFIHQDMAQVNEEDFAQVGVWIPLVDVSLENGTLGILPHTHFTIPPHRSLYHDLPYSKIYDTVQDYMQPVELKAGDLFLFDIRLLHKSYVNKTPIPRVSIATSLVPKEAPFCMAYRDESTEERKFELLEIDDNFYLEFADFKSEKVSKPGKSTGVFVDINERYVSESEFLKFCAYYKLSSTGMKAHTVTSNTFSIQEPDEKIISVHNDSGAHATSPPTSTWNRLVELFKLN